MSFDRLTWGVKASFRSYVEAAGGTINLSRGATRSTPRLARINCNLTAPLKVRQYLIHLMPVLVLVDSYRLARLMAAQDHEYLICPANELLP